MISQWSNVFITTAKLYQNNKIKLILTLYAIFWYVNIKSMSNINKYFNKISKKRDLGGESNLEEDRKKVREGSFITSNNDATENDIFQQFSITNHISKLLKYLKALEVKISEIYNLSNDTRSMQIKDNKKLVDLTQVNFLSKKFNEFENDFKEKKNKQFNGLKERVE